MGRTTSMALLLAGLALLIAALAIQAVLLEQVSWVIALGIVALLLAAVGGIGLRDELRVLVDRLFGTADSNRRVAPSVAQGIRDGGCAATSEWFVRGAFFRLCSAIANHLDAMCCRSLQHASDRRGDGLPLRAELRLVGEE